MRPIASPPAADAAAVQSYSHMPHVRGVVLAAATAGEAADSVAVVGVDVVVVLLLLVIVVGVRIMRQCRVVISCMFTRPCVLCVIADADICTLVFARVGEG